MVFVIEEQNTELQFVAALSGPDNTPKICLCIYSFLQGWEPSNFSGLGILEEFCSEQLKLDQKRMGLKRVQALSELDKKTLCDLLVQKLSGL